MFRFDPFNRLDIAALTEAMTDMVKHSMTDELKALPDFYGSPVGKSAMQKFGAYMADTIPAMQAEMIKASAKLNQSVPESVATIRETNYPFRVRRVLGTRC